MVPGPIVIWAFFYLFSINNLPKNEDRAWAAAPMDLPQRELFVRSLGYVVALSVRWQNNFLCVRF